VTVQTVAHVLCAQGPPRGAYLEAFLRIGSFTSKGPDSFQVWLRQLAQNDLRDAIKALEREKRPPLGKRVELPPRDDSYVALYEFLGATSTTPSRTFDEATHGSEPRSVSERSAACWAGVQPVFAGFE